MSEGAHGGDVDICLCPTCLNRFDSVAEWRSHYQQDHPIASRVTALVDVIHP